MSESGWFIINNLGDFTNQARVMVYDNFGNWEKFDPNDQKITRSLKHKEKDDLDIVLSFKESLSIIKNLIKKQRNRKLRKIRYMVNDTIFYEIIEALNTRMTSNIINNLVKKGLLESAYDENINDFIFWIKEDENKEDLEKPETD